MNEAKIRALIYAALVNIYTEITNDGEQPYPLDKFREIVIKELDRGIRLTKTNPRLSTRRKE